MTLFKLITLFLLFTPGLSFADEFYCTYIGGVARDIDKLNSTVQPGFDGQPCRKGDALEILTYDAAGFNREWMYLASEIAQLCDLEFPVTIIGPIDEGNLESGSVRAVCVFVGEIRELRR